MGFFLRWGIDYQKKSSKTKFGRITSWILTTIFPTVEYRIPKEKLLQLRKKFTTDQKYFYCLLPDSSIFNVVLYFSSPMRNFILIRNF